jgi:hypothetical protein
MEFWGAAEPNSTQMPNYGRKIDWRFRTDREVFCQQDSICQKIGKISAPFSNLSMANRNGPPIALPEMLVLKD